LAEPPRILIVTDAERFASLRDAVTRTEFVVETSADCEAAFERLRPGKVDLVVIELADTASDRLDLIRRVRRSPDLESVRLLVVGEWGTGQPALALSLGADGFEPLPPDAGRLLRSIERLLPGADSMRE
jgi:CheY-like chemotaxis protein